MPDHTRPAFDLVHINNRWSSPADDIYRTILGIFAEEGKNLCGNGHATLAEGRRDALECAAHALKSAAANVGVFHLSCCAKESEDAAKTENETTLEPLVARVESAWSKVRAGIAQERPVADG